MAVLVSCGLHQTFISTTGGAAIKVGSVAIITFLPSTKLTVTTNACINMDVVIQPSGTTMLVLHGGGHTFILAHR